MKRVLKALFHRECNDVGRLLISWNCHPNLRGIAGCRGSRQQKVVEPEVVVAGAAIAPVF